jgi:hypothetical protein
VTSRGDPYRVLGVPQGASIAEVKRAYRLLAKRNHPDAGEGSLARFLEIQAAYEMLARNGATGGARSGPSRSTVRRPAQEGPRAAGPRRASGERADDPATPPPPGTEWARRPREGSEGSAAGGGGRPGTGAGAAAGATGAGSPAREPGAGPTGERGRRGRHRRSATLGSTTYDEAGTFDDAGRAAEPTWDGADWYGPVSGTYWTVNPKEYADPRKHGPEYLARSSAARVRNWRGRPPAEPGPVAAPGAAPTSPPDAAAQARPAAAAAPAVGGPDVGRVARRPRLVRLAAAAVGRLTGRSHRVGP